MTRSFHKWGAATPVRAADPALLVFRWPLNWRQLAPHGLSVAPAGQFLKSGPTPDNPVLTGLVRSYTVHNPLCCVPTRELTCGSVCDPR